MGYRFTLIASILFVFAGGIWLDRRLAEPRRSECLPRWGCRRIVSMSPSITETLYALGLGDQIVGVSRFCDYPPDVRDKPRVGGYFDPNLEAVLMLKPDLVVVLEEQAETIPAFAELDLETLTVNHKTVAGVIDSLRKIGRVCGRGTEGRWMAMQFEERLAQIRDKTKNSPRPRVLVTMRKPQNGGHLNDIHVAGADEYFDAIIELAGGRNACRIESVRNPAMSPEGIIWLDPDVIVDLVWSEDSQALDRGQVAADWNELPQVKAVRNGRILVFEQRYVFVPGPRLMQFIQVLARRLHPELDWREVWHLDD